ncbi:MAG TPA: CoA transferase, partial [Albitalea sp.]
GCNVEVSMMESVYPTLASSLGLFYGSGGSVPMRTGNRHTGLSLCPYNVYPASDGYIAIITNNDQHWRWLVRALGRPELADDPRYATVKNRCERMDEVDDMVGELTRPREKAALFDLLIRHRVPCAPVRTVTEVVEDPHLHARGSLRWIDHPEYGRIVVPTSPLRFGAGEPVPYEPSAALGADTDEILARRLSLSESEIRALRAERVL